MFNLNFGIIQFYTQLNLYTEVHAEEKKNP